MITVKLPISTARTQTTGGMLLYSLFNAQRKPIMMQIVNTLVQHRSLWPYYSSQQAHVGEGESLEDVNMATNVM